MGLFSFIKEAGEKLFGGGDAHAAAPSEDLNVKAAQAIANYISTQNLASPICRFSLTALKAR